MSSGPAIYFPSASADEVIRYADVYADTELEKALLRVIEETYEDREEEGDFIPTPPGAKKMYSHKNVEAFIAAVRNVADSDDIPWKTTAILHGALQEISP